MLQTCELLVGHNDNERHTLTHTHTCWIIAMVWGHKSQQCLKLVSCWLNLNINTDPCSHTHTCWIIAMVWGHKSQQCHKFVKCWWDVNINTDTRSCSHTHTCWIIAVVWGHKFRHRLKLVSCWWDLNINSDTRSHTYLQKIHCGMRSQVPSMPLTCQLLVGRNDKHRHTLQHTCPLNNRCGMRS